MATQKEVTAHLFKVSKWVGELVKKGTLPSGNRKGRLDICKCREAYVAYFKGVDTG